MLKHYQREIIDLLLSGYTHRQIANKMNWSIKSIKTKVKELRRFGLLPESIDKTHDNIGKYWLYILLCNNNSYYVGITSDLNRRMYQHWNGVGAIHTKENPPIKVCFAMNNLTYFRAIQKLESHVQKNFLLTVLLANRNQNAINVLKKLWQKYNKEESEHATFNLWNG